jgi:hypothetical protein
MIRILGAGAWGTALAALWSHPQEGTPTAEIELIAHTAAEAAAIADSEVRSPSRLSPLEAITIFAAPAPARGRASRIASDGTATTRRSPAPSGASSSSVERTRTDGESVTPARRRGF